MSFILLAGVYQFLHGILDLFWYLMAEPVHINFLIFFPVSEEIFFIITSEKEVMVSMSSFAKALWY